MDLLRESLLASPAIKKTDWFSYLLYSIKFKLLRVSVTTPEAA